MTLKQWVGLVSSMVFALNSGAIVVRQDVQAESYIAEQRPEYLVDMPSGGHGVLIAPNWIVTASHLIFSDFTGKSLKVGGKSAEIEKVVIHPGVQAMPEDISKGPVRARMSYMLQSHDIALVKLTNEVPGATPVATYNGSEELGQVIKGYGKGTTGDGHTGSISGTQGQLRQLQNRIDETHHNWISITFDQGQNALPLEGIDGSWDSGGPLVMEHNGKTYLVGLFSWDYVDGNLEDFVAGRYGNKSYQIRISRYRDWIRQTMEQH